MACLELIFHINPLSAFPLLRRRYDDDFTDRLNSRYSFFLFIVLGIICGARESYEPMNCWVPAQFTPYWADYANRICWISNTYYVPMGEDIPQKGEEKKQLVAYYQWVPLVIFLQAILFLAPRIIWTTLNMRSAIHVNKLMSKVVESEQCSVEVQERVICLIVRNLDRAFLSQMEYRTGCLTNCRQRLAKHCFLFCGKRYGNYLTMLYLFIKILYISNGIGQFFLLNLFLGGDYHLYGFYVANDIIQGRNWTNPKHFPHVTLCDFEIRSLGHRTHEYVVQCALPANLLSEKVFIFVWFWLLFVSASTTFSFIAWIWSLFRRNRQQFLNKYLKIMKRNFARSGNPPSKKFCEDYLRQDGVFVLQLIGKNTNDVVVGEMIWALWDSYQRQPKIKETKEV